MKAPKGGRLLDAATAPDTVASSTTHDDTLQSLSAADQALRAGHRIVVVMPAYNAARTLQNCWQQIPKPWVDQVILVDDGSRDGTAELARTLPLDVISHPHNVGHWQCGHQTETLSVRMSTRSRSLASIDYYWTIPA